MNPTTFLLGWIGLCLCIFGETKRKEEGAAGEFLVVHILYNFHIHVIWFGERPNNSLVSRLFLCENWKRDELNYFVYIR